MILCRKCSLVSTKKELVVKKSKVEDPPIWSCRGCGGIIFYRIKNEVSDVSITRKNKRYYAR